MKKVYLIVLVLTLVFGHKLKAQNTSNKGKDFYIAYSGHVDALTSRLTLFLSADQATTYQVFVGSVVIANGSIGANTCLPVIINPNSVSVYIAGSDIVESNKAILVVTIKPISLYSVISNSSRTGGTMVLPTNTLGKEYYTFSYQSSASITNTIPVFAQFTIVATENDTDIEITPTKADRADKHLANQPFVIKLNKGEIYQYQSVSDLSGSYIRSINGCKPIAVFSGNTWASFCEVGNARSPGGGDNLYQQVFPVASWGRKFVTAPFHNTLNGNTDIIRVIVAEDNTTISVDGSTTSAKGTPLSNPYAKGSILTFFSKTPSVIEASNPISVAQYQTSQTCNLSNPTTTNNNPPPTFPGDPEITVLNPVEQTLNNITVYSRLDGVPTSINKFFINVIIKTIDAPSFRLDGNAVNGFVAIDGEYSYRIIDVTNSQPQHRLTAAGGFSAIAYGYGNVESYAYLAGANIQDFTFQPELAGTAQSVVNGCIGLPISLKINLPYKPTKLEWDVQNGDGIITELFPAFTGSLMRNGIEYFTFVYPKPISYTVPNDYTFKVVATKPSADNCGATEELSVDFTVDPLPTAIIAVTENGCAGKEISFSAANSTSNVSGKILTKWLWDFGDGNSSTLENPKHTYSTSKATSFKVSLSVGAENGCFSEVANVMMLISPQPVAAFQTSFNGIKSTNTAINTCILTPISFDDQSTIGVGANIIEWVWDFGDKTTSALQNPVHSYASAGTYTVSLLTKSNTGCESSILIKTITVTDLPVNDYTLPEVCAQDGLATFTNLSTDYDKSITGLTSYIWDFGDPSSGTLNRSTSRDGAHKYSKPGTYRVVLTIKNANGCTVVVEKDFTVNDSSPLANFEVVSTNFCSNKALLLKNKSMVDIGTISRLEWYINGVKMLTDEDPQFDKLYTFNLPSFGGNADKNYDIRLSVYSGETCSNQTSKQLIIKPSPQLSFTALVPVCENDGKVKIIQGIESSSQSGTAKYSGRAITSDGTFDPKLAGPGIHAITYTFTSASGCDSTLVQDVMVFESPTADAGPLIYMLSGGKVKIPAIASGKNVTHKWTPSLGLDADDVLNPTASPEKDTEYTLTVSTNEGCTVQTKVMIKVLGEVQPPSSFTPNGDGINDFWNILLLDSYPENTVEIYNRAGQRIFASKGYKVPFDGNFQNKPLPVGVYYYIIAPKSGRKTVSGPLTLIR